MPLKQQDAVSENDVVVEIPKKINSFEKAWSVENFDIESLPHRDFQLSQLLLSGYISVSVAPGGAGKSMVALVFAISIALGKELLEGFTPSRQRNVLVINNEDDAEEMRRRISAICSVYDIDMDALTGKLFVYSGYEQPVILACESGSDNTPVETQDAEYLIQFMLEHQIETLVADPYVSFHQVGENDNKIQDSVAAIFRRICARTKAAILLVAHTRKTGGDSESHAGNAESLRGAGSVTAAARVSFTLARMSKDTAKKLDIDDKLANTLVRLDDAKKNLSPMDPEAKWIRLLPHKLPNDDWVGVPVSYDLDPHVSASRDKNEKGLTGTRLAELIEQHAGPDIKSNRSFLWTDVRERVIEGSGYSQPVVYKAITLLSQSGASPTRINPGNTGLIDFWIEKSGKGRNAPWLIHRSELQ